MITVINRRKDTSPAFFVGRPSPLGNPFPITPSRSRAQAIAAYRLWLAAALATNPAVREEFERIVTLARHCDVRLSCWCAPAACHADIIKQFVERELESRSEIGDVERCRVCGCTDDRACPGGCSWAAPGLCSSCVGRGR